MHELMNHKLLLLSLLLPPLVLAYSHAAASPSGVIHGDLREISDGRCAVIACDVCDLFIRLRDVRHDGRTRAVGELAYLFQVLFRNCVRRVWRYGRSD